MSTYNSPVDVVPVTLVRSSNINDLDAAVAQAFALLPDETLLKHGTDRYAVDTGTANSYLVSLPVAPSGYVDGLKLTFRPLNANTGAATINVNGLGVKAIKLTSGADLLAGDITSGVPLDITYSSATGFFHLAPNSANYAAQAAAAYDSFDDRYLGSKTSDPTLDNDGNALLTGALYFNSVASEMRAYNGSTWAAAYLPVASYAMIGANNFTGQQTSSAGDMNLKTNTALTDADAVLTAAQLKQGLFTITPTAPRTLTTDSAVNIVAALSGYVVGSNIAFTIVNNAAFNVTLAAGAGVSIVGNAVINNGSGTWRLRINSASSVTVYTEAAIASSVVTLSNISAATGSATLANGNNPIAWNWAQTTASQNGFKIGETSASTGGAGSQVLLSVGTLATSTADPLQVQTRGVDTIRISRTGAVTITALNGTAGSGTTGSSVIIRSGIGATNQNAGDVTIDTGTNMANATSISGNLILQSSDNSQGGTGSVTIKSGTSGGASPANGTGNVSISVGNAGTGRLAGVLTITGGQSLTAQSGNSGGVVVAGGAGAATGVAGGLVSITGGAGFATTTGGVGGAISITGGTGGLAASGGNVTITGGTGGATGSGGTVTVQAGSRPGTGAGSNVSLIASNGVTTGVGGNVSITAGNGVSAAGGDITLTCGTGSSNGQVNFVNSSVANGTVATTITSLGPTGASTTIVGWLRIKVSGVTQYIPYW